LGMGFEMGATEFALAMVIGFPVLGALVLAMAKTQMPPNIFSMKTNDAMAWAVVVFALALAAVVALPLGSLAKAVLMLLAAGCIAAAIRGRIAWDRRVEMMEEGLPDSLLRVSGLPKGYRMEKIFEIMAGAGDAFSEEAGKTLRQLRANVSPEKALNELWERNGSFMLRRMCDIMLKAHVSGAGISERMHEMAEDLLTLSELRRERENALAMQKYTLMLGALLVPVILTVSMGVLSDIGDMLGTANAQLLAIAPKAIAVYVVFYSALTSFYIADGEGKASRMVLYFGAMAGAGLMGIYILSGQIP
ncbi:MAG: type II secretion system F family protein, partial [Candidatus ainarchaeum sp.]|nr:type II secretion system F family protein [Candidatus ainarchaeum sp.]